MGDLNAKVGKERDGDIADKFRRETRTRRKMAPMFHGKRSDSRQHVVSRISKTYLNSERRNEGPN